MRAAERVILPVLAIAAAVAAHSGAFAPASRGDDLATLQAACLPIDRSYRPATRASFEIDRRLGGTVLATRAVDAALAAAAAAVAYGVLLRLLGDVRLASLGAALWGVLPVRTEAIASLAGRPALLSTLSILAVWLLALVNSSRRERGRECPWLALAASIVAFFGPFAEEDAVAAPAIVLLAAIFLRRRIPWLTLAAVSSSVLAYAIIRRVAPGGLEAPVHFLHNPLVGVPLLRRVLAGVALFGMYAWKVVGPFRLSADYSYDQIPVTSAHVAVLVAAAVGAAGILGAAAWLSSRRAPLVILGIAFFVVALLPKSNLLSPAPSIFAERYACAASFGVVLAVCGAAAWALRGGAAGSTSRRRAAVFGVLGALVVLLGGRAWFRSLAWSDPWTMALRMPEDAPRSAWSRLQAARACVRLSAAARPEDVSGLRERARAHLDSALRILPSLGRAEELQGRLLYQEGKWAEAIERLNKAATLLAVQNVPEVEPVIYRFRGECQWRLGKPDLAIGDLDPYIQLLERGGQPRDPVAHNFRGLARAALGKLDEALRDFTIGIEANGELPELWNNRGFCRYKLGDFQGAIEDYRQGLELCRLKGPLYSPTGESVWGFLLRISAVEDEIAKAAWKDGNAAATARAAQEAARLRTEAAGIAAEAKRAGGPVDPAVDRARN